MKNSICGSSEPRLPALALLLLLVFSVAIAADDDCQASGDDGFVCGPQNAEDLVLVPATHWIIASGMVTGAPIYLIDSQQKSWTELYPGDAPLARQDMETYGACPGSPDPNVFYSHGLNIRQGTSGHSTLYVVGHGGREAIEVFDVDATGPVPFLTWVGCVMLPEGMVANSVASLDDGSLLATIPLHPGRTIAEAMTGQITGAVYQWSPGETEFTQVQGTGLPYGNGIEVSDDGREFYVASSGQFTVTAYSNSNPARKLRTSAALEFIPDNLHMGPDGNLITGGLVADDPVCGKVGPAIEFDLGEFASCPRPFIVKSIDTNLVDSEDLARGPANEHFSNITMGLPVGDTLWIGSFTGDRIGYLKSD